MFRLCVGGVVVGCVGGVCACGVGGCVCVCVCLGTLTLKSMYYNLVWYTCLLSFLIICINSLYMKGEKVIN